MTEVQIKKKITGGSADLSVNIDGTELNFNSDGLASQELANGHEYALQWFVLGDPGTTYELSVAKPATIKCRHAATLERNGRDKGKDAGVMWFTVPEAK